MEKACGPGNCYRLREGDEWLDGIEKEECEGCECDLRVLLDALDRLGMGEFAIEDIWGK